MGQCGSHFVRENFAVEKMVDDIYNLYLKLAAGGLEFKLQLVPRARQAKA